MIRIVVNGEERELSSPLSLEAYIETLGLSSHRVVVEYNGAILPREEWANTILAGGDKLEIVHFVGGG